MSIEQEKMIVESLSSLYPLKDYEEDAIRVVLDAIPHWIPVTERLPAIAKEKKTNAEKFSEVFGFTATELWAKPENEFLDWLNAEVTE